MKPLVSVIIVSYNTRKETVRSIRSAFASSGFGKGEIEVIVVDNNSTDDSVKYLKKTFPAVKLIANKSNKGFGGGNNQGAEVAQGKYLLLLNSDAFLSSDSLRVMVDRMEVDDNIVSVGPQLLYADKQIQLSGGYLPTPLRVFRWLLGIDVLIGITPFIKDIAKMYHIRSHSWYTQEQYPDWLMGACVIFRRSEFLQVGGFDEKIFMYAEEVELYQRLQNKFGKKVLFTPDTNIIHLGGVSSKRAHVSHLIQEIKGVEYIYAKHSPFILPIIKFVITIGVIMRIVAYSLIPSRRHIVREYLAYFK